MERKSDLILSTCIVGMQRFGADVVLISGAAETERQTREQRTENGSRLASLFGHRWSRLPKGRFRWKQAIGTRQAVGIHIPIHNSSRADRNRHPMPPEDQNYAVYFRPFPQPGISAVFSTSCQLPSSRFWGSSGRHPWHGRQASRLLPSTVSPGRRRGNSLPPLPSLCMFQKRELSSSPDLSQSGCAVYLNSLKPEIVLACRDSCSQYICLQQSVARMASCFYSRISYVLMTPFASITHSLSNSSY